MVFLLAFESCKNAVRVNLLVAEFFLVYMESGKKILVKLNFKKDYINFFKIKSFIFFRGYAKGIGYHLFQKKGLNS
jgi:hypothetical protein